MLVKCIVTFHFANWKLSNFLGFPFLNLSCKGFVIWNYFRLMVNLTNFTKKCPFPLLLPIDKRNCNQIFSSALIVIRKGLA